MVQTTEQRKTGGKELARRLFQEAEITADLNWDDVSAAIGAIDDAMDLLPGALDPVKTVKQNLVAILPEPFKSNTDAQQKAIVLMVWAMVETGQI